MKTDNYLRDILSIVLSFGHQYKYRSGVVEKRISHSQFFQQIEKNGDEYVLCENIDRLLSTVFYDANTKSFDYTIYNECAWLSELYMQIQRQTGMTFEAIFLYLPIDDGYSMFPLYHEMDFSQSIQVFLERMKKHSILYTLMRKRGVSVEELAKASDLSYSMISALRSRKKDIGKVGAKNLLKIASYLCVRIETLVL